MKHITEHTSQEFDHAFGTDDLMLPPSTALNALASSVGGRGRVVIEPPVKVASSGSLERDGSQFILISHALLERISAQTEQGDLPIPQDARDFALWLLGIANGNFSEDFACIDEQIAAVYGYGVQRVRQKRKALIDWQEEARATLVAITERKFNPEKGKHDPTMYRVIFGRDVASFIRQARDNKYFQRNPVRAIEQAEESGLIELVEEVKDGLQPDLSVRRKEKNVTPPKDDKVVKAGDLTRRLKNTVQKWSDIQFELGEDFQGLWESLVVEMSQTVALAPQRFAMKAERGQRRDWKKPNR